MNKQKTQLPGLGFSQFVLGRRERAITRWLPKRPPARAQVAAVVMVVIIRAPIARVNNARIIMPMPWTAVARALLKGWKAYDMKGAV